MGCDQPTLKQNIDEGMARQKKILTLIGLWFKEATNTTPPPVNDPSVLSYNSECSYYYTSDTQNQSNIATLVTQGLNAAVANLTGVTISTSSITQLVSDALANTTKSETSQGYSTCVLQSFPGKYENQDCLYKPLVVAVSFNFSSSEYDTTETVAAFGYWVYLLCTQGPLPPGSAAEDGLMGLNGEKLNYEIPPDMSKIGQEYMTLAQLDQYNP